MAEPHVAGRWHQDWDLDAWSAEVGAQLAGTHSRPWIVGLHGEAVAYVEVYRAAADLLAEYVDVDDGDLGVHVAIGDPSRVGEGLGGRVLRAVSDGLFRADPSCRHVLGDPDAGHLAARGAFASAGFALRTEVELPHKRAALMVRPRPEDDR